MAVEGALEAEGVAAAMEVVRRAVRAEPQELTGEVSAAMVAVLLRGRVEVEEAQRRRAEAAVVPSTVPDGLYVGRRRTRWSAPASGGDGDGGEGGLVEQGGEAEVGNWGVQGGEADGSGTDGGVEGGGGGVEAGGGSAD